MSNEYFRVMHIQNKIDKNVNTIILLKVIPIIFIAMIPISIFASRLLGTVPNQKNFLWILSLLIIILMFFISAYLLKKNKEYEFELYYLELESLERKKRVAKIREETLPDYIQNKVVKRPVEEISLPILFYGIMLILDVLAKFLIFDII